VHRSIEAVKPLFEARGHRFEVVLPEEPVWLRADPARLEHVLVNLLNNACKYTEPGGHVWLTAACEEGRAVVTVKDSGVGISPELLPHVFERAPALEQARDRASGGLGIGLMLVRRLLELHGGSVSADSDGPGKGSEFTIALPVLPAATVERSRVSPAADRPMGNCTSSSLRTTWTPPKAWPCCFGSKVARSGSRATAVRPWKRRGRIRPT